ncbi:MAG: DegT/DnrJ/EryC1/StrS family aminotransferase [Nitrospirae bacterium]|nr:DegT/DnrJ/EryC1/StrS family aminotransferase [Nitrospirota bacterium]
MNVPLVDLKAEYQLVEPAVRAAVDRVLGQQQFILGPTVEACEQAVARWIQALSASSSPLHGIGVASGTDALILALRALDIGPGDAVITTPYSFFATASSIVLVGATPLFADIDPGTLALDPEQVEGALRRSREGRNPLRVRALLPVHLFGHCADMDALLRIARREGIEIIEDAAQAIGAACPQGAAGAMGRIGCLSFFPTKNLGGYGDGGMVLTGDADLAASLRRLRNHGMVDRYHHHEVGLNSRLDALQAAVLLVKLDYLAEWTAARRRHAARYAGLFTSRKLLDWITPPVERPGFTMVYHHYVVRAKRRDELAGFLRKQGVGCEVYYPVPLHLQPCFERFGWTKGAFPAAERASEETLALPVFPLMTEAQQTYVVDQIARFYQTG